MLGGRAIHEWLFGHDVIASTVHSPGVDDQLADYVSCRLDVPDAVGLMGHSTDRSVCVPVQSQASCFVQQGTLPIGHLVRFTRSELVGVESFSPLQPISADSTEARCGQSRVGNSDPPLLAEEELVSAGIVQGNSIFCPSHCRRRELHPDLQTLMLAA